MGPQDSDKTEQLSMHAPSYVQYFSVQKNYDRVGLGVEGYVFAFTSLEEENKGTIIFEFLARDQTFEISGFS